MQDTVAALIFFFFPESFHFNRPARHLRLRYLNIIIDTTGSAGSEMNTVKVSGQILICLTVVCLESFIFSIPVIPRSFPPAGTAPIPKFKDNLKCNICISKMTSKKFYLIL